MSKLLKAQFYRLWRTKSYYICIAVSAAMAILSVFVVQMELNAYKTMVLTHPEYQGILDSLNATVKGGGIELLGTCMSGSVIPLLAAIVVSLFVCIDFSSGAIKNAHAFQRSEIYFSTLITNAVSTLIMMFAYMLFCFVVGSIAWGVGKVDSDAITGLLKMIGIESLLVIGCVAFFVLIATLLRNSGGTIAVNLGSLVIVSLILSRISLIFGKDVVLNKYWICDAIAYVANLNPMNDDIIRSLIVAGCYIVATTAIGLFTFQKRDIK